MLPIPAGVGGRYSVFTPVGLLPAAICCMDPVALLKGAAAMDKLTQEPDLMNNPAYLLAASFNLADVKKKKNILVMMPYSSALLDLPNGSSKLWAESLARPCTWTARLPAAASTPVRALAPRTSIRRSSFTRKVPRQAGAFLRVEQFRDQARIPAQFGDIEGVGYLGGHSLAELINAEQRATEAALAQAGRPSLRLEIPRVDADALGQLMYMFEVATVFAGGLYKVNPLDQPGVETGKHYTNGLMGKKGFEKEKDEIETMEKGKKRFTL